MLHITPVITYKACTSHLHHVRRTWVSLFLKIGGRGARPHLLLLMERTAYERQQMTLCCAQRTLHPHRLLVGSGRMEPHKLGVRYYSVLEVQEEIMLCFVALKPSLYSGGTLCDSLDWFPSLFSFLVSWLPTGSRQEVMLTQLGWDSCRLWSSVPSERKSCALG